MDRGLFDLDEMTGALAFKAAPNHEEPLDVESTAPANDAGNNEYVLEVSATSGSGERQKTTPQTVVVTVTDVNEAPGAPGRPTVVSASVTILRVTWAAAGEHGACDRRTTTTATGGTTRREAGPTWWTPR